MDKKLSQTELIIVIAGAVALLGSFLPWIDYRGFSVNAWDGDYLLFPTYAWVGIFGTAMAAVILLRTFANVSLPSDILGFTWPQIHLVLAFFAALIALSFLIGGDHRGIGFWLSFLAAAGLVVGAVRLRSDSSTSTM